MKEAVEYKNMKTVARKRAVNINKIRKKRVKNEEYRALDRLCSTKFEEGLARRAYSEDVIIGFGASGVIGGAVAGGIAGGGIAGEQIDFIAAAAGVAVGAAGGAIVGACIGSGVQHVCEKAHYGLKKMRLKGVLKEMENDKARKQNIEEQKTDI